MTLIIAMIKGKGNRTVELNLHVMLAALLIILLIYIF